MPINLNDATAVETYLQGQTTRIERVVNESVTSGILYPQFLPVITAGNPWAPSTTFVSANHQGQAGYINGNADDVPMADAGLDATVKQAYMGGIGYGYGLEEINASRLGGFNLAEEKAYAARRAYEVKIEDIAFNGDATKGFTGLKGVSASTATPLGSTITKWVAGSTTANQIALDLVGLVKKTGAGNVQTADTIVMDDAQFDIADTTFFANSSMTAIDYLRRKYPSLRITGVVGLTNSSSKSLYIAYRRSPDVIALYIPMPHRFLPVYQAGPLRWEVPGIFRVAGVNFKRKQDIAFALST